MSGFEPALGRAFNISEEELAANREGRLSTDQELMWRNTVRVWGTGTRRGARLLGFGLGGAAIAIAVAGSRTPGTGSGAYIFAGAALVLIGLLGAWFVGRGRRATRAIGAGTLRTASGEFNWTSDLNSRWWGTVGEARFAIDRLQEEALVTGAAYRVYYLPADGSAWVQSIERD